MIPRGLAATGLALTVALIGSVPAWPAWADDGLGRFSVGGAFGDVPVVPPSFNMMRLSKADSSSRNADFRVEYRPGLSLVPAAEPWAKVKPWVAVEKSADGAVSGGGGILVDVPLGSFVFTPSIGAGLIARGQGSEQPGSVVQFRSQLEVGYTFDNQSRLSVGYSHTAVAGTATVTPGSDAISVYYHLPTDWLLGKW